MTDDSDKDENSKELTKEPQERSNPLQKLKKFTDRFKKTTHKKEPYTETETLQTQTTEKAKPEEPSSRIEKPESDKVVESLLRPQEDNTKSGPTYNFEEFVDERILISHDIFGKKEMKIKVLEVSDEHAPLQWKLGDRVKVNKILVTVKHLDTQEVEEAEFDIEAIEKELAEKRHYTSTNRWVPTNDIKNGYVIGARHTSLISDAIALEYIAF